MVKLVEGQMNGVELRRPGPRNQDRDKEKKPMRRRDVLKGLVALPLATSLNGCRKKTDDKSHPNTVEVHLDGAFALVIQENKSNSILAFSPRPKNEDELHEFYFNGSRKDSGKSYHFKLALEGRERDTKPDISPGLKDFSFNTERWRVGDSLISIELPAPDRITFSGHRSPVTFLADRRQAFMPTNHILKYDVKGTAPPQIECSEPNIRCVPSLDSFPGVTRFFFEVGPKRSLEHSESYTHAISFFNYILHQSFPDLEEKYRLAADYTNDQRQAQMFPHVVPAVFRYGAGGTRLRNASYVVDCEFAGPLVLTRTAAGH
jgi:hypothetical protein